MNIYNRKGPYISVKQYKHIQSLEKKTFNAIEMPRNNLITPSFSGLFVKTHNGKKYVEFIVSNEMVGHKFGEFANTRSWFLFKKKSKNK